MTLHFLSIVRTQYGVRSQLDQRFRVNKATCDYRGDDGEIYRRGIESKGEPLPPTVLSRGDGITIRQF